MKCLYHLVGSFINQLRSVQLNSVSEKDYKSYHKPGLSKPLVWFSLPSWTKSGYALFPSGWICSTKAAVLFMICYWIIKTMRKIQLCACSWPTAQGRRAGQTVPTLCRIPHRARQRDTTPGRSLHPWCQLAHKACPEMEALEKLRKWLWRQGGLQGSLAGWALVPGLFSSGGDPIGSPGHNPVLRGKCLWAGKIKRIHN